MKAIIGTRIYLLILFGFLTSVMIGCTQKDNIPDYATAIAGTYFGTMNIVGTGSVSASSELTKRTETLVDLSVTINGTQGTSLSEITVINPSNGSYSLSYKDPFGSLKGTLQGTRLSYTITSGSSVNIFIGTR